MRSGLLWVWLVPLAGCVGGANVTGSTSAGITTGDSGSSTDGATGNSGSGGASGSTGGGASGTTGTINANTPLDGLTLDALHFAVLGDCRPATDQNNAAQAAAAYPTAIIKKIFGQIAARDPQFALFSGDVVYTYNPPDSSSAAAQIDQFLQGRNLLDRPFVPALGNHEDTDGINLPVWKQKFNQPLVYYGFTIHTPHGDVRFTVADDTYWNDQQLDWIDSELSSSARYHILLKHQPSDSRDNDETRFKSIISQHRPTLILTGHSHTYDRPHTNELVLGTAGAPLVQGAQYGYAMVDQLASGDFQVTVYSSSSNAVIHQWTAQ